MTEYKKNRKNARTRGFGRLDEKNRPPLPALSDRTFGLVFASVFGVWAGLSFAFGEGAVYPYLILAGLVFAALALTFPAALAPLNKGWARVTAAISGVVNAVVMGAVFFVVLTPVAVVMRRTRKEDPLGLRPRPGANSYWIASDPPRDGSGDMTNQY